MYFYKIFSPPPPLLYLFQEVTDVTVDVYYRSAYLLPRRRTIAIINRRCATYLECLP